MGRKFRFIHVADTHLGHAGNASRFNEFSSLRIDKVTDDGINVRQDDINRAFTQVIDLALEHNVDAVLHAGDSWDFWKDNPIVENVQTKEIERLFTNNIHYVEVVGNHDLPKQIGKGCHLETLGRFPMVHTVYKGFYEQVELPEFNVVIHAVPSTFKQEILDDSLAEVAPVDGKINIGMGHFGVTTIKHYAENSINSLVVDLDILIACEMDYFALGDYHTTTDFGHNIWYSGSIERLGFGEIDNKPCVLLVEIDEDTKEVSVTPLYLNVRPMIQLPSLDVEKIPETTSLISEINNLIKQRLSSIDLTNKIVRFRVRNLPNHLKNLIDVQQIRDLTESALHFKIEFPDKVNKTKEAKTAGNQFVGVLEGWNDFVDSIENDGSFDKNKLKDLGYKKLLEVYEDASN